MNYFVPYFDMFYQVMCKIKVIFIMCSFFFLSPFTFSFYYIFLKGEFTLIKLIL